MENTRRIRFSLDDGSEIIVQLNDNPAAEALYEMLPLELSFEDSACATTSPGATSAFSTRTSVPPLP